MPTNDIPDFDMVVFGATGDLAGRKLFPALYYLDAGGLLPGSGRILAVTRRPVPRGELLAELAERVRLEVEPAVFDEATWRRFAARVETVEVEVGGAGGWAALGASLGSQPGRARVFYLAVPPDLYVPIGRDLAREELINPATRIVLEKPIGTDLASARAVNDGMAEAFAEEQIFRIDHYLGKETVQNLMVLRFGNALFEPLWRAERIDHVQITVAERLGIEGREEYYDGTGALRDMVQNHLLQLLCLVAMEPPSRLAAEAVREEKVKVMRSLRPIETAQEVAARTVRGQYRRGAVGGEPAVAYLEEEGIPAGSTTESFVALKAEVDNWRWAGAPIYLRTGKRMQHRLSEIVIQFKSAPDFLFRSTGSGLVDNRLAIRLQPDESIKLGLMVKRPGGGMRLQNEYLNLDLKATSGGRAPGAYERLLMDVLRGITTLFMHREEVEQAWRWIEPIRRVWDESAERPRSYPAGSWGPEEAIALILRDGRSWFEHTYEP